MRRFLTGVAAGLLLAFLPTTYGSPTRHDGIMHQGAQAPGEWMQIPAETATAQLYLNIDSVKNVDFEGSEYRYAITGHVFKHPTLVFDARGNSFTAAYMQETYLFNCGESTYVRLDAILLDQNHKFLTGFKQKTEPDTAEEGSHVEVEMMVACEVDEDMMHALGEKKRFRPPIEKDIRPYTS